jgi:deazaflavin-dependent oxidoreductase (nitroreductase family)
MPLKRSKARDATAAKTTVNGIPRVEPLARPKWKRALGWWTGGVLIATKPGAAVWRTIAAPIDAPMLNATDGRIKLTGIPVVVLTSTGARSGKRRNTPLTYVTDGDNVILVASNWGGAKHPGWYHNLRANPDCELHVGSRGGGFTAHEVFGEERDRLFALANALYAGFGRYASRTQGIRTIRVLKLTPRAGESTTRTERSFMDFRKSTALVTGASSGIGAEFARQLAARDTGLVLVARRLDKLDELRDTLTALHPDIRIDVVAADLSVPDAAASLADEIAQLGRPIDILVNNAGVGSHGDFKDEDPDKNAAMIQLNCGTLVELTGRYYPAMVKAGRGLVINLGSTASFQPTPSMAVYGGTKAFVWAFTEALWQEAKGTGVRVLTLCPGGTDTEFFVRTEKEFLTRGRQSAEEVVETALRAVERSTPTVVSGRINALLAAGYRITPRRLLLAMAQQRLRARRG